MEKKYLKPLNRTITLTALFYVIAVTGSLFIINACKKTSSQNTTAVTVVNKSNSIGNAPETAIVTVAGIRNGQDANTFEVMFNQREQIFTINNQNNINAAVITTLNDALTSGIPVKVTTDPWAGVINHVGQPTGNELQSFNTTRNVVVVNAGSLKTFQSGATNSALVDNVEAIGVSAPGSACTNMIPDLATAQLIFNYFAREACNSTTKDITPCISFQYVIDGCYARAHKMCFLLQTKYNYCSQKIFSFANKGSDRLSVVAGKWNGCCVTWWYHVAPLVTVKTPQGPKAYVFDPGMFDEPVLLSVWLGAQENPKCSGAAHVSMYNIQPTASYSPASITGLTFDTDPSYSSTNATLTSYSTLKTCP